MKIAVALPSGNIIVTDNAGRWRLDLSAGHLDHAPKIERIILNGATGAVEIIVFASAPHP